MSKAIKTVGVVIIKNETVLLVRHGQQSSHITNSYGLPAGRVEDGESEEQAAIRELEEETGLKADIKDLQEIPVIYEATLERKDGPKFFSMKAFRLRKFSGDLRSSEETIPQWTPLSQLDSLPLVGNVAQAINDALRLL